MAQFDWGLSSDEGLLGPEMLDVAHFLPQYERLYAGRPFDDDLVWPAMPPTAIPWLEAMLGCPIRYSLPDASMWAEPLSATGMGAGGTTLELRKAWLGKLLEFVGALAGLARGRFAVGLPLMRGPWDMVAAALGTEALYLALYDSPESVRSLAAQCGDLWMAVAARLESTIPHWRGGHVAFLGLWAPAFDPMAQDDASVAVSPRLYRGIVRPEDARMVSASCHGIFHLHSAGLQVLDDVLEVLPPGWALNVDLDPAGPTMTELLPSLERVQAQRVPLHLLAFDRAAALDAAASLEPAGLAITFQPLDPAAERAEHPHGMGHSSAGPPRMATGRPGEGGCRREGGAGETRDSR